MGGGLKIAKTHFLRPVQSVPCWASYSQQNWALTTALLYHFQSIACYATVNIHIKSNLCMGWCYYKILIVCHCYYTLLFFTVYEATINYKYQNQSFIYIPTYPFLNVFIKYVYVCETWLWIVRESLILNLGFSNPVSSVQGRLPYFLQISTYHDFV